MLFSMYLDSGAHKPCLSLDPRYFTFNQSENVYWSAAAYATLNIEGGGHAARCCLC